LDLIRVGIECKFLDINLDILFHQSNWWIGGRLPPMVIYLVLFRVEKQCLNFDLENKSFISSVKRRILINIPELFLSIYGNGGVVFY